jgi:hypothetical protein
MELDAASLLCPFTTVLDIFMSRNNTAKQHCNNAELNVLDNTSLAVYHAALVEHWLVMGLKIDNSHVDARLSKMEVAIENIPSLTVVGNLTVNQLMEHEATTTFIANAAFVKEPKWTMMMAKNVR